jgi:hypothetical protein
MGSKRAADPLNAIIGACSGSSEVIQPPRWARGFARSFELGDLVTLAPEFRYSIAISRPDFGRYLGIVVETFANREYMVVWTNQPLAVGHKKGMFNGDHLIKVENADKALMHASKTK